MDEWLRAKPSSPPTPPPSPSSTSSAPSNPSSTPPEFGLEPADFARRTAADYWEVGASGRRYGRDFILQTLADSPPVNATTARWRASGHALRQLSTTPGAETYLLTYSLRQSDRLTRRSTLWQRTPTGWQILYHQGTLVSPNEDDTAP